MTRGWLPAVICTPVRPALVSTSSTGVLRVSLPLTVSGDQPCMKPRGRIFQPLVAPQFAMSATCWDEVTEHDHRPSVTMPPDQLRKVCR